MMGLKSSSNVATTVKKFMYHSHVAGRTSWHLHVPLRWQSSIHTPKPVSIQAISTCLKDNKTTAPCLSIMPTPMLLRTLMVTTLLSFPRIVDLCLPLMERLSQTQSWLLSPDQNPALKGLVKFVFYNNFAAGENETQVRKTIANLKQMGCYGVILGYARETMAEDSVNINTSSNSLNKAQIESWKRGNLRTVEMVSKTDFVGIK